MAKTISRVLVKGGSFKTTNTPGSTTTSLSSQNFSTTTTITGGINPGYRSQIARGENATTTLSVDAQEVDVKVGFCSAELSSAPGFRTKYELNGILPFSPGPSWTTPSFNSEAEGKAVAALYRKIRQTYNQFQGGVFLGELHQTVQLITSPVKAFTKLTTDYQAVQKRLIKSQARTGFSRLTAQSSAAARLRRSLAGNYLQWVFGVVPLMNDIKDISATIQRSISDPQRIGFKASGKAESIQINTLAPTSFGSIRCVRTEQIKTVSQVKYYGAYKVIDNEVGVGNRLERIQKLSGFTLRDFVPTIWNLLPYSFIVDYFVNIGDVLEALTTDTSKVAWLARTQIVTRSHNQIVRPDAGASKAAGGPTWIWYSFAGSPASFTAVRTTINRAKATIPNLGLQSKIEVRTGKKILNLLALILARR